MAATAGDPTKTLGHAMVSFAVSSERARMDIHRPKAAHSIREFLIEIGTIICGILIALGLEQAVEWIHVRSEVAEQRERLHGELSQLLGAAKARSELEPCIGRRLGELRKVLARHDNGEKPSLAGPIGRPVYFTTNTSAWTYQSTSKMPSAERASLAKAYTAFENYLSLANNERNAWRTLEVIDYAPHLTPQDWSDVRRAYLSARDMDLLIQNVLDPNGSGNMVQYFSGISPTPYADIRNLPQVTALCKSML